MQQQVSVLTLGIADLVRSRRFYVEGFGWQPIFQNEDIVFYQMNGFVLGTWLETSLSADMGRKLVKPGAFAMGHNVPTRDAVQPTMDRLVKAGGRLLKAPTEPPHGGFTGYVTDPDDHAWEIAWNPAWAISPSGMVTFGL
ncbi:VOC family protein [Mesorhizobium sp. CGMCC 1.15528]|uniref:VOC family protein n=1 Tax=Mesorhizobium zhangyense TaxID=1776730 RepID=A0A7C9VAY4_9HYPH|nr:VOC family protein [Mesorhizobium zhangyense]NGN40028.1 VOC family protein [Mesorhizobium zhangyense]